LKEECQLTKWAFLELSLSMKFSKEVFLWIFLFLAFMGLGYLHGYRPQDFKKSTIIAPQKFLVLTTEETLFTPELKRILSEEHHLDIEVRVSRNWQDWIVNLISNPSADLIILPSYWANTLNKQELLTDLNAIGTESIQRVSADFLKSNTVDHLASFLPLYWLKTSFVSSTANIKTLSDFAKDKNQQNLYLWLDEDLVLKHLQIWKNQGLWDGLKTKKILTMSLEDIQRRGSDFAGALESPVAEVHNNLISNPQTSALLIWGVSIPKNSLHQNLAVAVIKSMTETVLQEKMIPEMIFSSALKNVGDKTLPMSKRAAYVRDLNLTETLILEEKDIDAKRKLKDGFDLIL
jgi:hypothetical protein